MHDAALVRVGQSARDLRAVLADGREGKAARWNHLPEGPSFDQLHGEEHVPAVLAHVVDVPDVRVAERGCGARFADQSRARVLVLHQVTGEHFQSDVPAQTIVVGSIHSAHAARAEQVDDAVMGNGLFEKLVHVGSAFEGWPSGARQSGSRGNSNPPQRPRPPRVIVPSCPPIPETIAPPSWQRPWRPRPASRSRWDPRRPATPCSSSASARRRCPRWSWPRHSSPSRSRFSPRARSPRGGRGGSFPPHTRRAGRSSCSSGGSPSGSRAWPRCWSTSTADAWGAS